jgi:capsule polysaccharide export protein KpsE/RkpR
MSEPTGLQKIPVDQLTAFSELKLRMLIDYDEYESVLQISVTAKNAFVAAQVAEIVKNELETYYINYRTAKTQAEIGNLKNSINRAEQDYVRAREKLNNFRDQNLNVVNSSVLSKIEQLQSEFSLYNNIYQNLVQQLENLELQLERETPVFTPIEPVVIPNSPSSPKKLNTYLLVIFLGLLTAVLVVILPYVWKQVTSQGEPKG